RSSDRIHNKLEHTRVIRLLLKPDRPVNLAPGDYFHILLPGRPFSYNIQKSYPAVAEMLTNLGQAKSPEIIVNLTHDRHLNQQLSRMKRSERVLLYGPFTQSLYLERYETVLLIAKGLGIYDILPLAYSITKRKVGDIRAKESGTLSSLFRDITRKVALIWWLDESEPEAWVREQLNGLKNLDSNNVSTQSLRSLDITKTIQNLLSVSLLFRTERQDGGEPFKCGNYWRCEYGKSDAKETYQFITHPFNPTIAALLRPSSG
ncbi:hypothetical protein F5883DRAFT_440900, partial [Diaporthe sp. PMI_573]